MLVWINYKSAYIEEIIDWSTSFTFIYLQPHYLIRHCYLNSVYHLLYKILHPLNTYIMLVWINYKSAYRRLFFYDVSWDQWYQNVNTISKWREQMLSIKLEMDEICLPHRSLKSYFQLSIRCHFPLQTTSHLSVNLIYVHHPTPPSIAGFAPFESATPVIFNVPRI